MATEVTPPSVRRDDVIEVDDDRYELGSVAVVTGAASGIGRATAIAAAVNGLTVVAADIDAAGLDETASRAKSLDSSGSVVTVEADLADDAALDRVVETAVDAGEVRFLANIAGLQHVAPLESFPMDTYDTMQSVMVRAPVYLARELIEPMREAGGGCIGNMASVHGHYVTRDKVGYNVAKFAIRGLTQSIAAEGGGTVRAFSVSTGYVATPLVTDQLEATARRRGLDLDEVVSEVMLGHAPVDELMAPVDVANLFLLGFSDHYSHLNGGDMRHDGGMTLTYAQN